MNLFNLIALSSAVTLTAWVLADEKRGDDPRSIQGRYELVAGEEDGKETPPDRIKGSAVLIDKDTIVGTDKDRKEFFSCSYTLDTSSKPWKITMVSKAPKAGDKAEGVVKTEGDSVWICYAKPGGKAPMGFKTEEKQHCFKLKRVK